MQLGTTNANVSSTTKAVATDLATMNRLCVVSLMKSNQKVSDRNQPPPMLNLSLTEPAGSGSLHRLVGASLPPFEKAGLGGQTADKIEIVIDRVRDS
jgi:hypothetical protein